MSLKYSPLHPTPHSCLFHLCFRFSFHVIFLIRSPFSLLYFLLPIIYTLPLPFSVATPFLSLSLLSLPSLFSFSSFDSFIFILFPVPPKDSFYPVLLTESPFTLLFLLLPSLFSFSFFPQLSSVSVNIILLSAYPIFPSIAFHTSIITHSPPPLPHFLLTLLFYKFLFTLASPPTSKAKLM